LENNIWQVYKDYGVQVFALNDESFTSIQNWINTYDLTYPVLRDPNNGVYWTYGDGYIPYNVVIDQNFKVTYTHSGYSEAAIINKIGESLYSVSVSLEPNSTVVHHGDDLVVTATLTNNGDSMETVDAWVDAILPNHIAYGGNPIAVAQDVVLPSGASGSSTLTFTIPGTAPVSNQYWMRLQIGEMGGEVLNSAIFNFEIAE